MLQKKPSHAISATEHHPSKQNLETQAEPGCQDEASGVSVMSAPSLLPGASSLPPVLPSQTLWNPISLGSYTAHPGEGETTFTCSPVTALSGVEVSYWHSFLHSTSPSTVKCDLISLFCGQCFIPSLSHVSKCKQVQVG